MKNPISSALIDFVEHGFVVIDEKHAFEFAAHLRDNYKRVFEHTVCDKKEGFVTFWFDGSMKDMFDFTLDDFYS